MASKIITNDFSALGQTEVTGAKYNVKVAMQASAAITQYNAVYITTGGKIAAVSAVGQKAIGVAVEAATAADQYIDVVVFGYTQCKVLTGVTIGAPLGPTATSGAMDDSGATHYSAIALETSSGTENIDVFWTG